MTSLLERAATWAKARFDESTSIEVDYIAGAHSMSDLKAVPGNGNILNVDEPPAIGSSQRFDWIVTADDLWINSQRVEPAKGHLIQRTIPGGRVAVYEVVPSVDGRCYSISDQTGVLLRIHTQQKEVRQPEEQA
jgi:hypothetical protein